MSVKPPFTAVEVRRAASGYYEGHSVEIALLSKGIMVALLLWALVWPANANSNLSSLNWWLLAVFNVYYIIIVVIFAFFLAVGAPFLQAPAFAQYAQSALELACVDQWLNGTGEGFKLRSQCLLLSGNRRFLLFGLRNLLS